MTAPKHFAVVGAGLSGLLFAGRLRSAGHDVTIFEKSGHIGGVWKTFANDNSTVQTLPCTYALHDVRAGGYGRNDVLADAGNWCRNRGLQDAVRLHTRVVRIDNPATDRFEVHSDGPDGPRSQPFDGAIVTTGILAAERRVDLPGEADFGGPIGYGTRNDLAHVDWRGKDVVILGMGAYAIENMRVALTAGARKVHLVTTEANLIASTYYAFRSSIDVTFRGEEAWRTLVTPYDLIGRRDLMQTLDADGNCDQMARLVFSDFFFLAILHGRAEVHLASVTGLEPGIAVTSTGQRLRADVLVKNIGFDPAPAVAAMRSIADYPLHNYHIRGQRGFFFAHEGTSGKVSLTRSRALVQSATAAVDIGADVFLLLYARPDRFEKYLQVPSRIDDYGYALNGDVFEAFVEESCRAVPEMRVILAHHLLEKVRRTLDCYPGQRFVQEASAQWQRWSQLLAGPDSPTPPYPFSYRPSWAGAAVKRVAIAAVSARYRRLAQSWQVGR